jgi:hypothetical protein
MTSTNDVSPRPLRPAIAHGGRSLIESNLDSGDLSGATRALVSCGTIGGLLFAATYLIEGATRPGYDAWQQAISALSLGPGGWVQQVNFIVFGVLVLCSAVGWRQALSPGVGATWVPILEAITGLGLIVDGIFSQDPAPGYPPGAALVAPTLHGIVHDLAAIPSITALALTCFVFARRFAGEPRWRGWATYSAITGLLTIVFITAFGAAGAHGGLAGLDERVATGVHSLWGLAVVTRLLFGIRPAVPGMAPKR